MKILSHGHLTPRVAALGSASANEVHDVLLDGKAWNGDLLSLIKACNGDSRRLSVSSASGQSVAALAITAPLVDPTKIVAAPVNYLDHKAEMNEATHIDGLGVFLKAPSSLIGDQGVVRLPYDDRRFDQEGELACIIGRTARHISLQDAGSFIFGYTCLLDITMRGGEDRSTRKSFDTFTPLGPYVVTPDEVGDLAELRLTCSVNGQIRQDAAISDLIWDFPALIKYASSVMTLQPGDIISSGTPAGVGQISHGDTISVSVTRVGTLTVSVDAEKATHCPTKGVNSGPVPPAELTPIRPSTTARPTS